MMTFKYILSFVICTPIWGLCLYGLGTTMEWVLNRIAPWEEYGFLACLLGGIIALVVSTIIPALFIAFGMAAWELVALVFGLN